MATRWSRLHGELYLGEEWRLGAVEDAWGSRWCCGLGESDNGAWDWGDWLDGSHCLPGHCAHGKDDRDGMARGRG
jgi:hypothetical protein